MTSRLHTRNGDLPRPASTSHTKNAKRVAAPGRYICISLCPLILAGLVYGTQKSYQAFTNASQRADIRYQTLAITHFETLLDRARDTPFDPVKVVNRMQEAKSFHDLAQVALTMPEFSGTVSRKDLPSKFSVTVLNSSVASGLKHIDLSVVDEMGRFIPGLTRPDFEVTVSGRRLSVVTVHEASLSSGQQAIAILRDKSASTNGQADLEAQKGIAYFITKLAGSARLKLWIFSDEVIPLSPFTNDA